ncbi:FimV/HubP family polar landmark protein [Pseudomonas sp. AA-38]|uniref:FimV/HubP family polar landmark protein n=1 Tax=Pseudomonas sp. AA-38 TaxID=3028807 RepID=UPI0023F78299|nr:FimV/HubP family polar landmark protein [Pseudomonas sp. AA-38]
MARMRQLVLGVASGSALYSGMVPALGLGEITLHSALSQPLDAEIELLQVGDLSTSDMKVRLAPADVFTRSGVERFYFLNDLRFTPILDGSRNVIRVVSSKPVREPYLNFIVEVARPNGQLYREYTVLLDPPGSTAYSSSAASIAAVPQASAPKAVAVATTNKTPMPPAILGQRYRVQRGDSLWRIASSLVKAGSPASREALMEDIFALNQSAFVGGNRNRLRVDQNLLLPDSAAPAAAPVGQAPVAQPTTPSATAPAVQAPVTQPATSSATEPAVQAPASATVTPEAPAADTTNAVQDSPAEQVVGAPSAEVVPGVAPAMPSEAVAQVNEQLQEVSEQNAQLQSALAQMQSQLEELRQQMAEKDRQLQAISQEVAQRPPAEAATQAETDAAANSSTLGWSFWLVAGLPLLGLALFGLLVAYRRKAEEQPSEPVKETPAAAVAEPVPAPVSRAVAAQPVAEPDPLEGANVYIAYGRFAEAASALRRSIEQHPQRTDLRLRLCEVYGELADEPAFLDQQKALLELGVPAAQIEPIRARYFSNSAVASASAVAAASHQAVAPEPLVDGDYQLNLDDFSLDADWDLVSPFKAETPERLKKKAQQEAQEAEVDEHFSSNLQELPQVFEMDEEHAAAEAAPVDEYVLDEQFLDAFDEGEEPPLHGMDIEELAGDPEHMTKLNQALAYIKQGDIEQACDILNEVIDEGDEQEKQAARQLLAEIA